MSMLRPASATNRNAPGTLETAASGVQSSSLPKNEAAAVPNEPVRPFQAPGITHRPHPSEAEQGSMHRHLMPTVADTVRSLVSMVVVALFLLTFLIQPFRIPSESMERTLLVGDFLLVNKQIYGDQGHWGWLLPYRSPQRGDVVVFHFPLDPKEYVVKRIVGVPGDRIHLLNGVVYRNGEAQRESYTISEPAYRDGFRDNFPAGTYSDPGVDNTWWQTVRREAPSGDVAVPPGDFFCMGDNRNYSRDSRYWGFVPRRQIMGRPFVIYFSLREPSSTDVPQLPDDTLGHENGQDSGTASHILDFARWDRMFRIVR